MRPKDCLCRACGKVFSSLTGFDEHRVGNYTKSPPNYGRRCLTTEEMVEKGFTFKEEIGAWLSTRAAHAREAFGKRKLATQQTEAVPSYD